MTRKPTEIKTFPGQAVDAHLKVTGALPSEVQYTDMDGHALIGACADDGLKWATAFCQHARKLGYAPMDPDWVHGWFANAIEGSYDTRIGRGKTRQ